jgi:hypothetical protein
MPPSNNQIVECFDILSLYSQSQTYKTHSCCHNMKPQKNVTNEQTSDINIAFTVSAVTIIKPQQL